MDGVGSRGGGGRRAASDALYQMRGGRMAGRLACHRPTELLFLSTLSGRRRWGESERGPTGKGVPGLIGPRPSQ